MAQQQKFYVVWHGREQGIFTSWVDCERQVKGFERACYKAYKTEEEARAAFRSAPPYSPKAPRKNGKASAKNEKASRINGKASPKSINISRTKADASIAQRKARRTAAMDGVQNPPDYRHDTVLPLPLEVTANALAVDAACSGNPGQMEYRGVDLRTGQVVFHFGPIYGTNNVGEFLAIVHAIALLKQKGETLTIYSDSRNALLWVKARQCRTKLARTAKTEQLFDLIDRAEKWLKSHDYADIRLQKWETARWGEIPADFGRK